MNIDDHAPRLVYKDNKSFWKLKFSVSFHVFEYDNTNVLELFSYDVSTGSDFNRICFSRVALLRLDIIGHPVEMLYQNRLADLLFIRQKSTTGFFELEDALIRRDIEDRILGEYILAHITLERTSYGDITSSAEVQFCPPDDHCPEELVIFRPPALDGVEPYREIEIQIARTVKSSTLKNSISRQRKQAASENVISAFKSALLTGLMKHYDVSGEKTQASIISPAKQKFQRSVKKIMLQNAVAKVSKMLLGSENEGKEEKLNTQVPLGPTHKSKARFSRVKNRGVLSDGSQLSQGSANEAQTGIPTAGSNFDKSTRHRSRLIKIKQDSASIEKEVAIVENVIETFNSALINGVKRDIPRQSESYKLNEPPSAVKSRWKRSIKKVMLQNAVAKVSEVLARHSNCSHGDHIRTNVGKGGEIKFGKKYTREICPKEEVNELPPPPGFNISGYANIDRFNQDKGLSKGMFHNRIVAAEATGAPTKFEMRDAYVAKGSKDNRSSDGKLDMIFPVS